ncbi:MAG: hypothetical protein LCH46_15975 [Proteobacteria bacterium]|nr:hypothetical protein [Pseudomonadota bacterium]
MGSVVRTHAYVNVTFKEGDGVFVDLPDEIEEVLAAIADREGVDLYNGQTFQLSFPVSTEESEEGDRPFFVTVRCSDELFKLQALLPKLGTFSFNKLAFSG